VSAHPASLASRADPRELVQAYVWEVAAFWPAHRTNQVAKMHRVLAQIERHSGKTAEAAVAAVIDMVPPDPAARPAPVYVTGLGGSGSHWLAGMLGDLPGLADVGEVYFPQVLIHRLAAIPASDAAFVIQCIHLLHAWARSGSLALLAAVNSAAGVHKIPLYRAWDPTSLIIRLLRDPHDQVMSVTFRKSDYRKYHSPEADDREYLQKMCDRSVEMYRDYLELQDRADVEVTYERLRVDARGVLRELAGHLGMALDVDRCDATVFAHDAANIRSGRAEQKGNLDQGGASRGWRADACDEVQRVLHSRLAEVVVGEGYPLGSCTGRPLSAPDRQARVVTFPEVAIGLLDFQAPDQTWRPLAPACGRVRVPAGSPLRLREGSGSPLRLTELPDLPVGSLDVVCLAASGRLTPEAGARLRELGRLQVLDLGQYNLDGQAIAALRGLSADTVVVPATTDPAEVAPLLTPGGEILRA